MDYEKKYKEAQKWIESIYPKLSHEHQMEAEAFFPELCESEDEKEKKEIEHVMQLTWKIEKEFNRRKELVSWLEKQGEKNPTDEEMKTILRTEYEKGRADVLRCIDPDEMVADFCSQTLSKTRSLASIYRQGIIDILKRINRNEETSITGTRSINDCGM